MAVFARVRGRGECQLDPALGATAAEVVRRIASASESLTGSAATMDGVVVALASGEQVRWQEIRSFFDAPEGPDGEA